MLTSSPPQPSFATNVAQHDTWDSLVTSPLQYTKLVAHALTQKIYIVNQNENDLKPAQKDIVVGSVSSTIWPYRDDHATLPTFHFLLNQTNSTLS
jgi:hypothetical protein